MKLETYKKRNEHSVASSTMNSRMSALRQFREFAGEDPSLEDVDKWFDYLLEQFDNNEMKASSIRQYVKAVKYYFRDVEGVPENEFDHIMQRIPSSDVDHGNYLTEEEWDEMLNNIYNIRDKCLISFMYYYARRPGEVRLMNVEDIDLEENTVTFNILKKKQDDHGQPLPEIVLDGGESFRVLRATFELIPEVEEHLDTWLTYHGGGTETITYDGEEQKVTPLFSTNQGRISYDTIWRMVKREAERIGVDRNITPKSNRHSRATHLDWNGHEPGNIAREMLVHGPETNVIGAYIHDRDEEQVREVLTTDED